MLGVEAMMAKRARQSNDTVILGAGLAGLAATYTLSEAGVSAVSLEAESNAGGLARTVCHKGFRFDIGGHRFKTDQQPVEQLVRKLLKNELLEVKRSSKILLRGRQFDYPLQPMNAVFGLGVPMAIRVLFDYAMERLKPSQKQCRLVSLEDWVVHHYGRTLFNIFFKQYSEKIWGIGCDRICMEWVEQRIQGLSLASAIKNALNHNRDSNRRTLASSFFYPALGIGRIAEKFVMAIRERNNQVLTNARIVTVNHHAGRITGVVVQSSAEQKLFCAENFISSIPLATLVRLFSPLPPLYVRNAAAGLKYRDLVIVTILLDRPQVTDQSWIYIPEQNIPFARIHEPTNWSDAMAPPGQSLLVTEHFCFRGDRTWNASDGQLVEKTISSLEKLSFIKRHEVFDSVVLRVPKAYPLFELGYAEQCRVICNYLQPFSNLHLIGRSGLFKYYNMDDTIASGVEQAKKIIVQHRQADTATEAILLAAGM